MEHRFYIKTKKEQLQIQLWIGLIAISIILLTLVVSWFTGFYLLVILTIPIVISIIAPFFDVPSLKKRGELIYHSLLFISEKPKKGVIKIHGGTLFDYVFVIDKKMNGKQRRVFIIQQYLEGLLQLIEEYGTQQQENISIKGTSYIINEKTAGRLGFKITETNGTQKLILIFNFFNVLLTYSIAKGKIAFPNLAATKTFETTIAELVQRKHDINKINRALKNKLAD
ncbi:hypothetical protein [Aquimarina brevivitae]|uniref:Uncharacterized protein n=1 Tax=Aquimarina brevivitae TaxID=323412 RepID=A0A4Q7P0R2_9FLAO|nr:hypothetical protein [Aquimarina brevivitae]RZS93393.1 hypothetical protein EV197_1971 [Aquimarina brevivitae]